MIWPILEARAEIKKSFRSYFGSNEDIKKSFWNWLTFSYVYLTALYKWMDETKDIPIASYKNMFFFLQDACFSCLFTYVNYLKEGNFWLKIFFSDVSFWDLWNFTTYINQLCLNSYLWEHSYMTSDAFWVLLTYLPTLIRWFTT